VNISPLKIETNSITQHKSPATLPAGKPAGNGNTSAHSAPSTQDEKRGLFRSIKNNTFILILDFN